MINNEIINNINIDSSIRTLHKLNTALFKPTCTISFWGSRQIKYGSNSLSFNKISKRVYQAAEKAAHKSMTLETQQLWLEICHKIRKAEANLDRIYANKNVLTQFFCRVITILSSPVVPELSLQYSQRWVDNDFICSRIKEEKQESLVEKSFF